MARIGPTKEVTFEIAQDDKQMSAFENLVEGIPGRGQHVQRAWGRGESGMFEEWPLSWSRLDE